MLCFLFFFRESRDLLSFAELFKCNFPQGNGISLVPRIFRLPTRGSGRPLPLVGRRKTPGTRLEWDRAQKCENQYTCTALALKSLELISSPILTEDFTRHVMCFLHLQEVLLRFLFTAIWQQEVCGEIKTN